MSAALSATPAALAIELEPAAILQSIPPEPLSRESAEMLASAIGDDLRRILGDEIANTGMVMPAGLYDLTELLRPGLPMVETMLDVYRGALRGGIFEPQLLALGTAGGRFALPALAPQRKKGSGPLLLIPFALVAPGQEIDAVRRTVEKDLLEKGKAALETDRTIRQLFGVNPINLTYASFNDLSAMLKVQLDYVGFSPLWTLIESALYRPDEIIISDTDQSNRFISYAGEVFVPFLTFDRWAKREQLAGQAAIAGYENWLKAHRRYIALLEAHGIVVTASHSPDGVFSPDPEVALSVAQAHRIPNEQATFRETLKTFDFKVHEQPQTPAVITLTEQWSDTLGPIALTVMAQAESGALLELHHEYPLNPEAIDAALAAWQQTAIDYGATFHVETPKKMITNGDPSRLHPWLDYEGHA